MGKFKDIIKVILLSLTFSLILIGILGAGIYFMTYNVLSSALISTSVVIGIGYLYNLYTIQNFNKFVATKQADVLKEEQKRFFNIECCECGAVKSVPIDFSIDMVFRCDQCNVNNKIFYTLKSGRTTDLVKETNVLDIIQSYAEK